MIARHILARARGVPDGTGSLCAVCGASPFDAGRPSREMFGDTFADWEWLSDAAQPEVCAGCVSLLAGRPGDDPPPLRTLHCLAVEGEPARYPRTNELAAILRAPPAAPFVLCWAPSMKRHASLRAGVSSATRMDIGGDTGRIIYLPAEHGLVLDAIEALLSGFVRDDVCAGDYSALNVAKFGPNRWAALETVIAPHRPSLLLDLLCAAARRPEATPDAPPEVTVIDIDDERAADLVSLLAEASAQRRRDGLGFWKSFLRHRLARYAHLPLRDFTARMMGALACEPGIAINDALARLDTLARADVVGIERSLRQRGPLVCAYAQGAHKARMATRFPEPTEGK